MKINHNISAMQTLYQLNKVNNLASQSMERLSSGLRINSAADDAAGMAISNKMDSQIRGLAQANRNALDGISMIQTAEGATNEMHAILQRMRELSVQAANDTYSDADREKAQLEIDQLSQELDRISETTEFNTKPLLGGADGKTEADFTLQIGANENQVLEFTIAALNTDTLGLTDLTIEDREDAENAISVLDEAISIVSKERAVLGAVQNRIEHTSTNLDVSEQNLTAAKSRIEDADMAYEMTQYTQQNVLSQAATSMLAQANQRPQQVLQLLQG